MSCPSTDHNTEIIMAELADFKRLETKVDKLSDAMEKLIRVEERQSNQGERIGLIEQGIVTNATRITEVQRNLDQWVNRGIGVWGLAATLWMLYTQFFPHNPPSH
jgi:hypothetical protein